MSNRYAWIDEEWRRMGASALTRQLRSVASRAAMAGTWIELGGKSVLNLSSNNYLGLAHDQRLIDAAMQAVEKWGAGAGASRLVTGNHSLYEKLEETLAAWKGREAALVFANGYQANTGVISALVGRGDAVFSDRLNHASIVDGIILSRAEHYRYRHNDPEHVEYLLKRHGDAKRKLIITDSIFSMDGDMALLADLAELADRYDAWLMVDEAHAGGVRGEHGEGLCHELGVHTSVDVIMGTFSKAFGVYGAYVCADEKVIRYLSAKTRSLVYSTALPPAVIASVQAAHAIVAEEKWRREKLKENALWVRQQLRERGFAVDGNDTPIIPITIGDNGTALLFSRMLEERGIAAAAIRPPTVPEGTARIRLSVMATHTRSDLTWAIDQIEQIQKQLAKEAR